MNVATKSTATRWDLSSKYTITKTPPQVWKDAFDVGGEQTAAAVSGQREEGVGLGWECVSGSDTIRVAGEAAGNNGDESIQSNQSINQSQPVSQSSPAVVLRERRGKTAGWTTTELRHTN